MAETKSKSSKDVFKFNPLSLPKKPDGSPQTTGVLFVTSLGNFSKGGEDIKIGRHVKQTIKYPTQDQFKILYNKHPELRGSHILPPEGYKAPDEK